MSWRDPFGEPGPYTDAVLDELWRLFGEPSQGITRLEFDKRIQAAAWWYRSSSSRFRETPFEPSPSERERALIRLSERIRALCDALPSGASVSWEYEALFGAATELADPRHGVYPPNAEPRMVTIPGDANIPESQIPIWPVDDSLLAVVQSLRWLIAVSDRAAILAKQDKKESGGSRVDEAAHRFAAVLKSLFEMVPGRRATAPIYDSYTEETRGEFFLFANLAFSQIDGRAPEAIAALLRRALFSP